MKITSLTTWRKVKLGEVVEIIDGDRGKNYPKKDELLNSGHCVFLDAKNVSGTKLYFNDVKFISERKHDLMRKGQLQRGDFVLTTRGTVGNVAYYDSNIPYDCMRINSGMVILRPKQEVIADVFFYFFLIGDEFENQVEALKTGSAQPQLPIRDLKLFELELPPIADQKRIADILSAFDDKIELNNKISKNLEATAQAIFKEWFVNFKFSGYEKVNMVDSELGKIPEGWEVKRIEDVAKINKGVSYSSEEIKENNGGLPMINLANFLRGGGFKLDGIKFYSGKYNEKNVVKSGDIIIAMTDLTSNREVIGHPARVPIILEWNKILISLDVCSLETRESLKPFLYYLMLQRKFSHLMASSASGTNVSHLNKSNIENYLFAMPKENIVKEFNKLVDPIFYKIEKQNAENNRLVALRDLLLPKLMSGEIRV